ncbi:hypothetical protein J3459_022539 [Metarhizium acridum]|nr:hypothetical protein J3459_022539 [Metarhizium acridum]
MVLSGRVIRVKNSIIYLFLLELWSCIALIGVKQNARLDSRRRPRHHPLAQFMIMSHRRPADGRIPPLQVDALTSKGFETESRGGSLPTQPWSQQDVQLELRPQPKPRSKVLQWLFSKPYFLTMIRRWTLRRQRPL